MARYLKQAQPQPRQINRDLVERVPDMLDDIERNRDAAVRRDARQLDKWESPDFRVSVSDIAAVRKAMGPVFKDDFEFCKMQVTDFAKRQRDSLEEFEEEFGDGISLGQKIIPVMCAAEGMLAHEITANVRVGQYAQRRSAGGNR